MNSKIVSGRLIESLTTESGEKRFLIDPTEPSLTSWWNVDVYGQKLSSNYKLVWEDNFTDLKTIWPDGGAWSAPGPKWFSPVRTDGGVGFGAAKLMPPGSTIHDPFAYNAGNLCLEITAKKIDGQWYSGHIQTMNAKGQGHAFGGAGKRTYYEARMAFPDCVAPNELPGFWPSFWAVSASRYLDPESTQCELDVIEYYGTDPKAHHAAVHVMPGSAREPWQIQNRETKSMRTREWSPLWDGKFHRYGMEVTDDFVTFFLDGQAMKAYPTHPIMRNPLYLMVSLQLKPGVSEASNASEPQRLWVNYVRVFER